MPEINENQAPHGLDVFDKADLVKVANNMMPFGKYKGIRLVNLPEPYLLWFSREGFPHGNLGKLMELTLALKIEGLENLVRPLIQEEDDDSTD